MLSLLPDSVSFVHFLLYKLIHSFFTSFSYILPAMCFMRLKHFVPEQRTMCAIGGNRLFNRQKQSVSFGKHIDSNNCIFHCCRKEMSFSLPPSVFIHEAIISRFGCYAVSAECLADKCLIFRVKKGFFAIKTIIAASAEIIQ